MIATVVYTNYSATLSVSRQRLPSRLITYRWLPERECVFVSSSRALVCRTTYSFLFSLDTVQCLAESFWLLSYWDGGDAIPQTTQRECCNKSGLLHSGQNSAFVNSCRSGSRHSSLCSQHHNTPSQGCTLKPVVTKHHTVKNRQSCLHSGPPSLPALRTARGLAVPYFRWGDLRDPDVAKLYPTSTTFWVFELRGNNKRTTKPMSAAVLLLTPAGPP